MRRVENAAAFSALTTTTLDPSLEKAADSPPSKPLVSRKTSRPRTASVCVSTTTPTTTTG
eukprot:CAMPEP_0171886706 /NCGR_PEP_ID=MMETSP0992-20121227/42041_1 /TAXON_ID=483369 /ORGANISM="non described non described, Strain CCMP2098" /LENGTH=59 /DNA_ID=CAMNT_0012513377 /DNA_START=14 /DNA_END=189 /DNA_ORIENTATION=-